jgi:hypothetical protein
MRLRGNIIGIFPRIAGILPMSCDKANITDKDLMVGGKVLVNV